jgi:hypothetical protein
VPLIVTIYVQSLAVIFLNLSSLSGLPFRLSPLRYSPGIMNETSYHPKLHVSITLGTKVFVAGEDAYGKIELSCNSEIIGLRAIRVVLTGVQRPWLFYIILIGLAKIIFNTFRAHIQVSCCNVHIPRDTTHLPGYWPSSIQCGSHPLDKC